MSPHRDLVAVVLAGGASIRFGADKIAAEIDGRPLLDRVLVGLPDAEVIVVGPRRATPRPVRFVREDPVGSGPAAALVAGLAVAPPDATVVVVPGDAPDSGAAAAALLAVLPEDDRAAVIAVDQQGRDQPLQLALRPGAARAVVELAGPSRGAGASARRLVLGLGDALIRCPLPPSQTYDIDTPDQLADYLRGVTETAVDDRPPS